MNSLLHLLRALLIVVATCGATFSTAATVEDILKRADVHTVVVSPDGGHLAMVRRDESKDTLIVFRRPAMTIATGVSSKPGERFATVTWANATHMLVEPALDRGAVLEAIPTGAILGFSVDGTRRALLPAHAGATSLPTAIVSLLPDDSQHVLVAARGICEPEMCTEAEAEQRRLVKLNVETGDKSTIGEPLAIDGYFVSDPSGTRIMAVGRTAAGHVEVYGLRDGIWSEVTRFDPLSDLGTVPLTIDAGGRTFALSNKRGTAALYRWDVVSGETTLIHRGSSSDVDTHIVSFGGGDLLAVRADPGFPSWYYLDPDHPFTGTHKALRAAYPNSDVDVTSFTANGSEAVVRVHSDRNSGDFYLVNTETRDATLLAKSRPWLPPASLAKMQPLEMTARDTATLRGYVTTPDGPGPHPLVVLVHDNPTTSRDTWSLDLETQLLADNGYAVLQINYRGSAGLGQYYASSGAERDGRVVQRDLVDATRWAVERNIAAADRVCVYGRGYGGFAAAKALATSFGTFECAVAVHGMFDLGQSIEVPVDPMITPQSVLYVRSALDFADAGRSPMNRIGNIDAPIMLIGDSAQTTAMRDALRGADKAVEWRAGGDEVADYEAILAFLDRHLGAAAPSAADKPLTFGETLSARQARAFQNIVDEMRDQVGELARRKALNVASVRREINRIVDSRDEDVRQLVSDEQWVLYDAFKPSLVARLEADLDFVRVQ